MKKVRRKINKSPVSYVDMAEKKKNDFTKYTESGNFTKASFLKLLKGIKDPRKKELIKLKEKLNTDDYYIELQYSTGTYRLYIPTNLNISKFHWASYYIELLFNINAQTIGILNNIKDDKETYFIKDYNGFGVLQLSDFFVERKTKRDREIFKMKKALEVEDIMNEANELINRIKIFVEMLGSIERRIEGDIHARKTGKG